MKHNHHFFVVFYCLVATLTYNAMEKKNILNQFEEITIVKNPVGVKFLSNSEVLVKNEKCSTYTVNLQTKEPNIINSYDKREFLLFVFPQNNETQIVSCNDKTITINNAKTGDCIWNRTENNIIQSFAWNPAKNTIFLCYYPNMPTLRKYNYVTNNCKDFSIDDRKYRFITMHPKKEILCLIDNLGNIYWHKFNDATFKKSPILRESAKGKGAFHSCQYNSDGSYVAAGYTDNIILVDQNKKPNPLLYLSSPQGKFFNQILPQSNETFIKIAFHPNNSIIAILCHRTIEASSRLSATRKQYVRYYNVKSLQCIDKTMEFDAHFSYDLTFSPDGFTLIIALEGKCVKIPVSFAIKEKCLYPLYVLTQLKSNDGSTLPKDVTRYILEILCNNIISS